MSHFFGWHLVAQIDISRNMHSRFGRPRLRSRRTIFLDDRTCESWSAAPTSTCIRYVPTRPPRAQGCLWAVQHALRPAQAGVDPRMPRGSSWFKALWRPRGAQDDAAILRAVGELGCKWAQIAMRLNPPRTDDAVRNRYGRLQRKHAQRLSRTSSSLGSSASSSEASPPSSGEVPPLRGAEEAAAAAAAAVAAAVQWPVVAFGSQQQ